MSYQETYRKWLESPALSADEKEELRAISGDDKEMEARFFAPLEFGTAKGRGGVLRLPQPLPGVCPGGGLCHGRQRHPRAPLRCPAPYP